MPLIMRSRPAFSWLIGSLGSIRFFSDGTFHFVIWKNWATLRESPVGTFETCQRTLRMSAIRVPEVAGGRSKRREDPEQKF
jgi:hypothetical protein